MKFKGGFMKTNRLLTWISFFSFIVTAGFLGGCSYGGNKGTKIKISSWGDLQENGILAEEISDFEKLHPDIQIELERIPVTEYVTKLLTQVAGGMAPDVIFVEVNNFSDFYLRDALEPLNSYMDSDQFSLNDYYPQVIDRFTMNQKTFVIPRDTAPICVIYYNKNAFDECHIPYPTDNWDWNEFVSDAKKLMKKDKKGNVTRWGFVDDWAMGENWIYNAGGSYVDNPKNPTRWTYATDPGTEKGLQFRADLILKYKVLMPPASQAAMGGLGNSDRFVNGSAAMFLSGPWKIPNFHEIKNFKWDIVMQPKSPDGHRGFPTGGSGYGILRSSTHKKEAWELIKFFSGVEGAKKMATTGLSIPVIRSIAQSPIFLDGKDPQNKKMLLEAIPYSVYNPLCKNWSEVRDGIIGPEMDHIWNGDETPKEAMEKVKTLLEQKPPITN